MQLTALQHSDSCVLPQLKTLACVLLMDEASLSLFTEWTEDYYILSDDSSHLLLHKAQKEGLHLAELTSRARQNSNLSSRLVLSLAAPSFIPPRPLDAPRRPRLAPATPPCAAQLA